MENNLVKVKVPLPANDPSGGEAEWVWASPENNDVFILRSVPTFAKGLSYGDAMQVRKEGDVPVFDHVVRRGGHSTYRIYAKSDRRNPEVMEVIKKLENMHCDIEPATDRIVGIDVLPEADIYKVYEVLEDADRNGVLEFQEGHCGHPLHSE